MGSAHVVIGPFLIVAFAAGLMVVARRTRPLVMLGGLAAGAVVLRVVGGLLRHLVIRQYYQGYGDAGRYYRDGLETRELLLDFDFGPFFEQLSSGSLWGTQFVDWVSGLVLAFIGPNWRGEFVVFALLGFVGCLCFSIAYLRGTVSLTKGSLRTYLLFLCFFPSMWFWPSSAGKEGIILCALGIAVLGYVGKQGFVRWVPFVAGLALVFAIRPHVATVFVASVMVAEWFARQKRWTVGKLLQAGVGGVVFIFVLRATTAKFGFTDLEGAIDFYDYRAGQTQTGGSAVSAVGGGVGAVVMAYVNILFRPFLFEAHNIMALASALELTVLWVVAWRRRRLIGRALRNWRSDRFLRLGIPFTLLYVLMLGLTFSNLGLIARQRVLVMPFLFAIIAAHPRRKLTSLPRKAPG